MEMTHFSSLQKAKIPAAIGLIGILLGQFTSQLCAADVDSNYVGLRLWYRQPAAAWRESLFIGNGRLGGAVWGGVQHERIDLNEDTLWSGEPYENINTN